MTKVKCRSTFLVCVILILLTGTVLSMQAEQIEPGVWKQTSSTAGDCPDCTVTITQLSPHIIGLDANNGWIGFAYYISGKDEYTGFLELKNIEQAHLKNWKDKVFIMRLMLDKMTLNLEGETEDISFTATYRKAAVE